MNISLSEYTFTLKFCRIVFEKFDFQKVERERYKNDRITVDTESSDKQYLYLDTKLSKHNVNIR